MGSARISVALALAALIYSGDVVGSTHSAAAAYRVETSVFYEPLRAQGFWVEDAEYGMVWYPARRPRDWNPYADGRWIYTVEYGWYWDSDDPWGWATNHYGRWAVSDRYGWVWVPDDQWGPAWVEWRYGDGYVGWSPMSPDAQWQDGEYYYSARTYESPSYRQNWVFVQETHFSNADVSQYRAPQSQNAELMAASARSTKYAHVKNRVVNRSIDVAQISAATGTKIVATPISITSQFAKAGATKSATRIKIYRPTDAAAKVEAKAAPSLPLNLDTPAPDLKSRIDTYSNSSVGRIPDAGASTAGSVSGSLGSGSIDGLGTGSVGLGSGIGGGLGSGGLSSGSGGVGLGGVRLGR